MLSAFALGSLPYSLWYFVALESQDDVWNDTALAETLNHCAQIGVLQRTLLVRSIHLKKREKDRVFFYKVLC